MIDFDEATHTYKVDGVVCPSVTQVMSAIGLVRPYLGDHWYGERGTAVHSACELIDQGVLDWDSVDPAIIGFVNAYWKFKQETGTEWEHSEQTLMHPTYRYAGRPDRFLPLVDIKTGAGDVIQLEAYAELLRANGFDPGRVGYMLHLKEDGTYKLEPHKYDRKLLGVFLSAVTVWHFRKEKGLL